MGLGDGSGGHSELWLDFVEGMGGERETTQTPIPEVEEMMNWFHSGAREGTPEEALAAFYAYESQGPRAAAETAPGLRKISGADENTYEYLRLPTTADDYQTTPGR